MYDNAKTQLAGRPMTSPPTVESRVMDGLIVDLDKRHAGIREGVNRLTEFRHRLLNPRPADASKAQAPEPNPGTVEGRLQLSVRYADQLAQELHELLTDLERAA